MKNGTASYFSEAEFQILLELSGEGKYALFRTGQELSEASLIRALWCLFKRGMLKKTDSSFELNENTQVFRQIRSAKAVVLFRRTEPVTTSVAFYLGEREVWSSELMQIGEEPSIRVCQLNRGSVYQWLLDTEWLPSTTLQNEDVEELEKLTPEWEPQKAHGPVVEIEKYDHTGKVIRRYTVDCGGAWHWISINGMEKELFTQEAVEQMLSDCFGKEER